MDAPTKNPLKTLPLYEYEKLKKACLEAGYFKRTYRRHAIVFFIAIAGILFSAWIITLTDNLYIQTLNAMLAGFFVVQLGLLGHDLSHGGIFSSAKRNKIFASLLWSLGCGLSESRWFSKHNAHHQAPNHIGSDPDVDIPFVFSHEQASLRPPFYKKYIFPYQHILFWIGIWFVYPYNIRNSMKFLRKNNTLRSFTEMVFMLIHFGILFSFTFWFLPSLTALLFVTIHFLTIGIYMALVFAPNHKGEEMLAPEETYNWVYQITLTRNITPSPLLSYIFGGLDYQVEHHLFPEMSRFYYADASLLIKEFCRDEKIPYHETSWIDSLKQIHLALKEEAARWPR